VYALDGAGIIAANAVKDSIGTIYNLNNFEYFLLPSVFMVRALTLGPRLRACSSRSITRDDACSQRRFARQMGLWSVRRGSQVGLLIASPIFAQLTHTVNPLRLIGARSSSAPVSSGA
jgi:hypothetical protein